MPKPLTHQKDGNKRMRTVIVITATLSILASAAMADKRSTRDDLERVPPKDPREVIWVENSEV